MSFLIGRGRYRSETYPQVAQGSSAALARNFAQGPQNNSSPIAGSLLVPWYIVGNGSPGNYVPITPKFVGILRLTGMVTVEDTSLSQAVKVSVQPVVEGGSIAPVAIAGGVAPIAGYGDVGPNPVPITIPYEMVITPAQYGFVSGNTYNFGLQVGVSFSGDVVLVALDCTMEIAELLQPTG